LEECTVAADALEVGAQVLWSREKELVQDMVFPASTLRKLLRLQAR